MAAWLTFSGGVTLAGEAGLTVAIDDNYPPYVFRAEDGRLQGYLVDLWELWSRKTGTQVHLRATDWAHAQALMESGRADVLDTLFDLPERRRRYDFGPPYASIPVSIYVDAELTGITGPDDLASFVVGAKAGDACVDRLRARGVHSFDLRDSYRALIDAAIAGQVRVFCLDEPPANYLLFRAGAEHRFRKAFPLYTGQFHWATHKSDSRTRALVERGFAAISAEERKALHDKWMGSELDLLPYGRYLAYGLLAALLLGTLLAAWNTGLRRQARLRTAELEAERGRLRTVLNAIPDLVWMKDVSGVYLGCNPAFERLVGACEADIVGRTDHQLLAPELAESLRATDRATLDAGSPRRAEIWLGSAEDGRRGLFEILETPVLDSRGQRIGVLGIARDVTAANSARETLSRSEARFRNLSSVLSDIIYSCVPDADLRWSLDWMTGATARITGYSPEEILAMRCWRALVLDADVALFDHQVSSLGEGVSGRCRLRLRHRDGGTRWVDSVAVRVREDTGEDRIYGSLVDVTERQATDDKLRLAAKVFASTSEGIAITDPAANLVAVNPAFTEITGYAEAEVLGQNPRILQSGRHDAAFYQAMWRSLLETGEWRGEIWSRRKNGEIYPELLAISAARDEHGTVSHYVAVFTDIGQLKHSQQQLDFLAHHDPLTGLPNRVLLRDRLEHALNRAHREHDQLALLFIDLDRFKNVNDTLGHPVGDALLRAAAERMLEEVRGGDTLARIGGDEFVLLIEEDASPRNAGVVASKLLELFARPINVDQHVLFITASIGVSVYPHDGDDADSLLKHADLAMYRAKEEGRNTCQFYEPRLSAGAFERMLVENALRGAVSRDELLLHYQPQVELASGTLAGVEALVRWRHPEMGLVPPGRFIPVAEDIGIVGEIGDWVLRAACRQMAEWRAAGLDMPRMSVNLSVQQIERGDLVGMVRDLLAEWDLRPAQLELEVTESLLMRQTGRGLEVLEGLRQLGVYLAVDDFGTGYSSLAYIKRLPVHRLKIDQSFVRDIGQDSNDESIVRAIVALGHGLGLQLVAEGVEQEQHADFLASVGCQYAQGYFFGRPTDADSLAAHWR